MELSEKDVNSAIARYERELSIAESLLRLTSSPEWKVIQEMFEKFYEGAFVIFQKVDPTDISAILESQMIGKVLNKIEAEIASLIQRGKLAGENLRNLREETQDE